MENHSIRCRKVSVVAVLYIHYAKGMMTPVESVPGMGQKG
jgi:hypothetical protein